MWQSGHSPGKSATSSLMATEVNTAFDAESSMMYADSSGWR